MHNKIVSLILTSYNCKDNIYRTLQSIEMQDYPFIEVIIVDGLSIDGTVDVIKAYEKNTKYQCHWISEKDHGIYDAMNKGIKMAKGDIIACFNDLFLIPNAVSLMVKTMEHEKTDGVHADLIYANDNKVKRYWKMGYGKILSGWMPGHPTLYLKKWVYDKYGQYNNNYKCSADYEFMVRILKDGNISLSYVPITILRMYYGGTSTESIGNYMISLKEAHYALKSNGVKLAWWIDIKRTIKVLMQFIKATQYKGRINEEYEQSYDVEVKSMKK